MRIILLYGVCAKSASVNTEFRTTLARHLNQSCAGLSESSATWDSDLPDRGISVVWSSEDFWEDSTSIVFVCLVFNESRENFFFNLSRKFFVVASSKECHKILPRMPHITKKLYWAKTMHVKKKRIHLPRRFPAINNVRPWNATLNMYQSDQVFLCCRHSYWRLFLFYVHRLISFSFLFVFKSFFTIRMLNMTCFCLQR